MFRFEKFPLELKMTPCNIAKASSYMDATVFPTPL